MVTRSGSSSTTRIRPRGWLAETRRGSTTPALSLASPSPPKRNAPRRLSSRDSSGLDRLGRDQTDGRHLLEPARAPAETALPEQGRRLEAVESLGRGDVAAIQRQEPAAPTGHHGSTSPALLGASFEPGLTN